jgi:hypothetical protein
MAIFRQLTRIVSHLPASHNFLFADHPTGNGPIWQERSTNMRRHEDWISVGVTAVFRQ